MRIAASLVLCASSVAFAQPTPGEPAAETNVPPARPSGTELPAGSWPGVSLEDLRGMRECSLEDPPTVVGRPVTCRPPILSSPAHLSFDVAWITGLVLDGADIRGVNGIAVDGEYWLTRSLGIGARYSVAGVGTATPMTEAPRTGIVGTGLLALHYRAFTDEADRDAFAISIGGGYATRDDRLGGHSPVVRAALSRNIGYITREKGAVTWAWEVAGDQALGASTIRTVTASIRAGFELGIRKPHNIDEPDTEPPVRYAIGGEFRGSPDIGLGATLALPLARPLLWRTTVFWHVDKDDDGAHALQATWAAVTGPRMILWPSSRVNPYLDVQGGPAAIGGDPSAQLGWLVEAEAGVDVHLGCQTRLDLGGRMQTRVDDGFSVRTGFFILRVEHGRAVRHPRARCDKDQPIAQ